MCSPGITLVDKTEESIMYSKAKIKDEAICKIITKHLNQAPEDLQEIKGGEIARTYKFSVSNSNYYIQFNYANMSHWASYEMRKYDQFNKLEIPVRKVICQGFENEIHYAITAEIAGSQLSALSGEEIKKILPQIFRILNRISRVDITSTTGYGWINSEENGLFPAWKEHIDFVMQEEPAEMFYGKWYELFDTTFLQKDVYEKYYKEMVKLYPMLLERRSLLHGNFSMANIIIDADRVSAVLDWQDVRYGDPLLDFTSLIFWLGKSLSDYILQEYYAHLKSENGDVQYYFERIKCYKYYLGLDALRFFAKTNQKNSYDYVIAVLGDIV